MNLTPNNNDYRKVVPLTQSGEYFFKRGVHAYHKNELKRAVKLLERAVKLTGTEPVFQIQLAAVLTEVGDYERSNEILHQVLAEKDEEYAECYFFIANNYVYLGYFERAEKAAERYLELEPNDHYSEEAYELLELFQMEREEGWELDFQEDEFISRHERAQYLLGKGEIEVAISLLQTIIDEHPTYWSAKSHLAEAYFRLDDKKAFAICNEILTEDRGNLFAICNLALFYTQKGKIKEAIPYIQAVKAVYPIDTDHYIKVAEVLCAVGAYDESYKRIKKLHKVELERRPSLLYCQGVAFLHFGEEKRALSFMEQAAKLGNKQALDYLSNKQGNVTSGEITYNIWYE